jgi:hypothetical protein
LKLSGVDPLAIGELESQLCSGVCVIGIEVEDARQVGSLLVPHSPFATPIGELQVTFERIFQLRTQFPI